MLLRAIILISVNCLKNKKNINRKQLYAIQQCIEFLKENYNCVGIFISIGSRKKVQKIVKRIRAGDKNILIFLRGFCSPRECATALRLFLRTKNIPILPKRAQLLLLSDNMGICPRIIALDAYGLLTDELNGINLELFISLMKLMKILSTAGSLRPTEVRISHAPYLLIPLLFTSEDTREKNWSKTADILNEMLLTFSEFLERFIRANEDSLNNTVMPRMRPQIQQPLPTPIIRRRADLVNEISGPNSVANRLALRANE